MEMHYNRGAFAKTGQSCQMASGKKSGMGPQYELEKRVLLRQFHRSWMGASTDWVYQIP